MAEQRSEPTYTDDRSYVFLLYPPSVASSLNPDLYIVRVQLRTMVVGLLVHQMLLHCIASVLLQGSVGSISSFCNMSATSPVSPKPPEGKRRLTRHIETFLAALDLSFSAAVKFDSRPGLKFLVQKVANLEQPANLYQQAGAAWTIKILTLFELCLEEIIDTGADLEVIKALISQNHNQESNTQLVKLVKQLKSTFDSLCNNYVDVVLNRDGWHSVADGFADRKIFLLVAQPDDFPEITGKEPLERFPLDKPEKTNETMSQMEDPLERKEDYRSLKLFDLANDYYMESGPESESDSDESKPSSRPRSPKKLVYRGSSECVFSGDQDEGNSSESNQEFDPAKLDQDDDDNGKEELESNTDVSIDGSQTASRLEALDSDDLDLPLNSKDFNLERRLRLSDDCLSRTSRGFVSSDESYRSKSLVELHRASKFSELTITDSSEANNNKIGENTQEVLDDNVDDLLRDYERSRRGFRINPFLCEDNGNIEGRNISKDCEAHRRAWAETLSAALEWTLALPDDQLKPLLPVVVGGVRTLTKFAVDPNLKMKISSLFYRIVVLYGLTNN
ncbi:hypothetical protein KQX54_018502 [Cotesia glomerata]|uniref:Uncharacterized protein n=2 Tax=Cotesia glomerata TaxID=32391 RepID=A0AAV7I9A5_COTGL|nr:hypothetical protein KQX54_018502 [Cotesia glomerata]